MLHLPKQRLHAEPLFYAQTECQESFPIRAQPAFKEAIRLKRVRCIRRQSRKSLAICTVQGCRCQQITRQLRRILPAAESVLLRTDPPERILAQKFRH